MKEMLRGIKMLSLLVLMWLAVMGSVLWIASHVRIK